MAKPVKFTYQNQELSFELGTKVDKKQLYGYAKRIAEKDGKALERGILLTDGSLLPRGAISLQRTDNEGTPEQAITYERGGQPVQPEPSSFDHGRELEPIPLSKLAEFSARDVYPLGACTLPVGLYRTEFLYRAAPQAHTALLLVRPQDQGGLAFLLIGTMRMSTELALQATYAFFDEDEEEVDADEMDFSMV